MQWIKEVELVDSVDELRSSSSTRGIVMPNFEELDARIVSALNKIIHNSHFKRKISLEEQKAQKEDRFHRGRQMAYLIYEQFPVIGTDSSVENYTDLFTIALRNDDIQEFDSKWDGILLSMTKIPHEDILEGLYKLRIREFEKFKTVLELYDLETHQKKLGPDYHKLKAMVKRSIEQEIRNKNFGARSGNFEKNALKEIILDMDRLASEDHSHIATQEEIDVYRGNWWIRSNVVNFDTMPTRRQLVFKKTLSTLYSLKKAGDKRHYEKWSQSSSSWWQWQTNCWRPYYENSSQRWSNHWLSGMNFFKNWMQNISWLSF